MSIHVTLSHRTHYTYDKPVTLSPQTIRLRPAPHCRTPVLSYSLKILPAKHFINWQQDPQSNYLARVVFPEKTKEFLVEVDLMAEMSVYNPFDFFVEPEAEKFPFTYEASLKKDLIPFLEKLPVSATLGLPLVSSPAISFSSNRMSKPWMVLPAPRLISRIFTPGAKFFCPVLVGWGLIPLRASWRVKATSPWLPRRSHPALRPLAE